VTTPDATALPAGTRLLHIGPPKTGTSSLQAAVHRARAALLAQDVRYAGSSRHSGSAVIALLGRRSFGRDAGPPSMRRWDALANDVRNARESRVLISSEFFADAEPAGVRRAVDELGRDRLHVVVTLRPLDRLIPSQWQQYVQSDLRLDFDTWLRATLDDPPGPTPTFWRRHRHDQLVARWAAEVGPERMTLVVIDESDHDHILRVFEGLLALRPMTLRGEADVVNRSMTWPEIEAVRAYSTAFKAAGLGNALYQKSMHFGAVSYMKYRVPSATEARIRLPAWAAEPVTEIAASIVDNLRASGIRVIGDLDRLRVPPASSAGAAGTSGGADVPPDRRITPEVAAWMAVGIAASGPTARSRARGQAGSGEPGGMPPVDLGRYSTYHLFGTTGGRIRRAVAATLARGPRSNLAAGTAAIPTGGPELGAAVLAARTEIGRRFDVEGLTGAAARRVRERADAIAARALAELPDAVASEAASEVPPAVAAWLALAMLEADGIVRPASTAATGPLAPARWWWLEPPDLARVPTRTVAATALRRSVSDLLRRATRRRPGDADELARRGSR
jgi:hypothetical protein